MKKFQFRLETVLRVKERKEEKLKHELMHLNAMKQEQEKKLAALKLKIIENNKMKNIEKMSMTDISGLLHHEQHFNLLRMQSEDTRLKILEIGKLIDKKREEVVAASKEKKTFEKLRERDFKIFEKTLLMNEQKQLDEVAISKFNRKEQHTW
jgi:flagellar FliJ protein